MADIAGDSGYPLRENAIEATAIRSLIVVGVDETASSRRALRWAVVEAVRRDARLQVVTAWTWEGLEGAPLAAADPTTMRDGATATQSAVLAEVLAELTGLPHPPEVVSEVVETTAAEALVRASEHADLVVVGTHGRGPLRAMLLGSVSQAVIRHSACPVVVMPPVHEPVDLGAEDA